MIAKVLVHVWGFPEEGIYGGNMEIDFADMRISRKFNFISVVCPNGTLTHSVCSYGKILLRVSNRIPLFCEHYGTIRFSGTKLLGARIRAIINSSVNDFVEKVSNWTIEKDSRLESRHALLMDDEAQCEVLSLMCANRAKEKVPR